MTPLLKPGLNLVTAKAQDMGYLWKHLTIAGGITYTPGIGPGDLNGDYVVNSLDLDIVRAHWGDVGFRIATAVPEPSSVLFPLIALGMSLAWRGRRRTDSAGRVCLFACVLALLPSGQAWAVAPAYDLAPLGKLDWRDVTRAEAINNRGHVVGYSAGKAFLWTPETGMQALPEP